MADANPIIDDAFKALERIKGRMECWEQLGSLALEASSAGAHISVRETGFIVFTPKKSELVRFDHASPLQIQRAIDRVTA